MRVDELTHRTAADALLLAARIVRDAASWQEATTTLDYAAWLAKEADRGRREARRRDRSHSVGSGQLWLVDHRNIVGAIHEQLQTPSIRAEIRQYAAESGR